MNKEHLRIIRDYVIGWTLALAGWMVVRNFGVTVDAPVTPELRHNIRMLITFGPLAGVLFGIVQVKFEKYLIRRIPLWKLSLIGLLLNVLIMGLIFVIAYNFFQNVVGFNEPITFAQFVSNPNAVLTFVYSIGVNFFLTSLRQVNLLLGRGNLWRFIKGDFYSPRVEKRVFMFVDLKGSTTIAEQLGHIKYSRFIQDCFHDLQVVGTYEAEVYQYVGDEVILSWPVSPNSDYTRCMKAFWAYQDELDKRGGYYDEQYGVRPTFKAGINLGEVTTAEVGEIKREIAYHGDTMNIAARIQSKCNDYNRTLLVSEFFHEQLTPNGLCDFELMGQEVLRGKQKSVRIYAAERK